MNKFVYITDLEPLLEAWPFLLEGLGTLNDPQGGRGNIEPERFFKILLRVALGDPEEGAVVVLTSKNDKPLGYIVFLNNTTPFDKKTLLVYAIYSNNKMAGTAKVLSVEMKRWARQHGFAKATAASFRLTGSAVRWFRRLGFQRKCIGFEYNIV